LFEVYLTFQTRSSPNIEAEIYVKHGRQTKLL